MNIKGDRQKCSVGPSFFLLLHLKEYDMVFMFYIRYIVKVGKGSYDIMCF